MKKRGQLGVVVKQLIISMIIISVIFFGYRTFTAVRENICNIELAKFEIDLNDLDKTVKFGSVNEIIKQVPCQVDEIYFFDLNKDINLDFIKDLPLIKDSLQSGINENIFLVKDDKVIGSFDAGNLNIGYPNYICFLPRAEKINFFVEGKGTAVSVFSACLQPECTFIPIEPEDTEVIDILEESVAFGIEADIDSTDDIVCDNCPDDDSLEFIDFLETRENVEIFRKYEYCREEGKTNVEIIIKPLDGAELNNFRYYESFPKECIENLKEVLNATTGGDVSIKSDPLIIWSFDEIKKEERLSYILDTLLTEECRETIEGLGITEDIAEGIPVLLPTNIDEIIVDIADDIPVLELTIGDILLTRSEKRSVNLYHKTIYNGDKRRLLSYRFLSSAEDNEVENDKIECSLHGQNNHLFKCEVDKKGGSLLITIQVTDGNSIADSTFSVTS